MLQIKTISKKGSWSDAYMFVIGASSIISGIIMIILSAISLFDFEFSKIFEYLFLFFISYCYWALIIGVIAVVSSTIVGIPTVMILKVLNRDSPINAAIVGGLSVLAFLLIISKGDIEWYYLILIICGFVCGYAFMSGYQKEDNL